VGSFVDDTAKKTGKGRSTVAREAKRGKTASSCPTSNRARSVRIYSATPA
jgi:hypothetical protein